MNIDVDLKSRIPFPCLTVIGVIACKRPTQTQCSVGVPFFSENLASDKINGNQIMFLKVSSTSYDMLLIKTNPILLASVSSSLYKAAKTLNT